MAQPVSPFFARDPNSQNKPSDFRVENPAYPNFATIRVVGVGGGGCNAVNRMIEQSVQGIEFITTNTDFQALEISRADKKIQLGTKATKGLGAGARPETGEAAAIEAAEDISNAIRGTDLLFVTAGMGGGTGSGAAPVIAKLAKELGILTVGVVTKPFHFEGAQRMNNAEAAIAKMQENVDALIVVPNDKLLLMADDDTGLVEAFMLADQVLKYGVTGISDLVATPGLINLDMADVSRVMKDAGICHMGIGMASGQGRMELAINEALNSPLLETRIEGAERIIISYSGSDLRIKEVESATAKVRDAASPNADIIMGTSIVPEMDDLVRVTVIASRFSDQAHFSGKSVARAQFNQRNHQASTRPVQSDAEVFSDNNPFITQVDRPEEPRPDVPSFLSGAVNNHFGATDPRKMNQGRTYEYRDQGYGQMPMQSTQGYPDPNYPMAGNYPHQGPYPNAGGQGMSQHPSHGEPLYPSQGLHREEARPKKKSSPWFFSDSADDYDNE